MPQATPTTIAAVQSDTPPAAADRSRLTRWIARFGIAGFLFFLIKGLLWLIVPAALAAGAATF